MHSLRSFDPTKPPSKTNSAFGEVLLILAMSGIIGVMTLTANFVDSLRYAATIITLIIHIACGALTHVIIGWQKTPNYELFSPRSGGRKSQAVRGLAWTTWSVVILLGIALLHQPAVFPLEYIVYGVVSISSNLGLLAHAMIGVKKDVTKSAKSGARDGPYVLTVVAVCALLVVVALSPFSSGKFAPAVHSMNIVLCAVMFAIPPLTHFSGKLIFQDRFDLYHPFHHRGRAFLTFQGLGWTAYTVAGVVAMLEWRTGGTLITSMFLVLSEFSVHSSLRCFEGKVLDDTKRDAEHCLVVRNELLVAAALSALALLLRVACDVVPPHEPMFPTHRFVVISSLLWGLAVPIAHMARADRRAALFKPFQGTTEYVALQAVGWSFYALCATGAIVVSVEMHASMDDFRRRTAPYQMTFAVQGVLMQIPFALIACSAFFDAPSLERNVHEIFAAVGRLKQQEWEHLTDLVKKECEMAMAGRADGEVKTEHVQDVLQALKRLASTNEHDGSARRHTEVKVRGVARIIVGCLAVTCVLFALAADHVKANSVVQALVFSVLCLLTSGATCTAVHMAYGSFVHGPCYKRWMPFRGGISFVAWQMCGGCAFASGLILFVFSLSGLLRVPPDISHVSGLIAAGVLCAVAPVFVLTSVFYFDSRVATTAPSFFEHHAEGIVSIVIFAAAWTMTSAYDMAGGPEDWALVAPPLLIGLLCLTVALPLAFLALRKSNESFNPLTTTFDNTDEQVTPPDHSNKRPPVIEFLSVIVLSIVPILALMAIHLVYHRVSYALEKLIRSGAYVLLAVVILLFISVATRIPVHRLPSPVVDVLSAFISFGLYSTLFVQTAAIYFAWNLELSCGWIIIMNMLVLMGPGPMRQTGNMVNVGYAGLEVGKALMGHVVDPWSATLNVTAAALCVAYGCTYMGDAAEKGTRFSPRVIAWGQKTWLWGLQHYFSLRVISDGDERICGDTGSPAVFGYHPHGVFPLTAVWMLRLRVWTKAVGSSRRVVVHGASILFALPIVRDIAMSFGSCVVTKRAIEHTLKKGLSPLIVPGGQAEMIDTKLSHKELILTGHHKGFIRIAVKHRVPLVPVFAFGEHNVMDNIHVPKVQRYFLRYFGFGFPVVARGRWNLPLPRSTPLTVVVGRSVNPFTVDPRLDTAEENTPEFDDAIDNVARAYFDQILYLVEKYKVEAGYPDLKVTVVHRRPY
jgi:hypothetical protein